LDKIEVVWEGMTRKFKVNEGGESVGSFEVDVKIGRTVLMPGDLLRGVERGNEANGFGPTRPTPQARQVLSRLQLRNMAVVFESYKHPLITHE
jgi:hypothetical protein